MATSADTGLIGALRRLRDPLLLFVLPVTFALLLAFAGYAASWPIGFDFRGTLWEPARALLDGLPIYPEPTRENVVVGNPTVYPPVFILASIPLALLPSRSPRGSGSACSPLCVVAAMWIVGAARLALPRARGDLARRRPRPLLREPDDRPRPARRARLALSRRGARSRGWRSASPSRRSSSSGRSSSGSCSRGGFALPPGRWRRRSCSSSAPGR